MLVFTECLYNLLFEFFSAANCSRKFQTCAVAPVDLFLWATAKTSFALQRAKGLAVEGATFVLLLFVNLIFENCSAREAQVSKNNFYQFRFQKF